MTFITLYKSLSSEHSHSIYTPHNSRLMINSSQPPNPTMIEPHSTTSSSSSSSASTSKCPDSLDNLLPGTGYKVRSSELLHVAQRMELLDNVITNVPTAVHNNPSDLATWVDSLLSELPDTEFPVSNANGWMEMTQQDCSVPADQMMDTNTVYAEVPEEDSGIRLVHLLMTCAESVQRGEFSLAGYVIDEMNGLMTRVNNSSGIGKVAGYFIDALSRRLFTPQGSGQIGSGYENEILYHSFYEACPYLKFAHFTANQAILEAFEGHDCVHVVDFNLMHGLQWPALIQALALRPGGPPLLRLTGIGPPSPDGRDTLREIGLRLAELARSVNVRFAFRGVAASRLEDVKPWMLQVNPNEAIALNSINQLHRLLGPGPSSTRGPAIDAVLEWIRGLNPKIMTVVEQEANHNQPLFLDRFTEALYYYSTMFDSLEACSAQPEKALAEMFIQREICNVVCCEGLARVERHEPLAKWRARLVQAGFKPLQLGFNAYKQASMLLTLFSAQGYCVQETEGCLTLGWHDRPLIAASAWQTVPKPNPQIEFNN